MVVLSGPIREMDGGGYGEEHMMWIRGLAWPRLISVVICVVVAGSGWAAFGVLCVPRPQIVIAQCQRTGKTGQSGSGQNRPL